jgi:hypothetical protein
MRLTAMERTGADDGRAFARRVDRFPAVRVANARRMWLSPQPLKRISRRNLI